MPKIESDLDQSNFDKAFTSEAASETPVDTSVLSQSEVYDNFTYEPDDSPLKE